MAGGDLAKKIATLGCFCGITAAYWDNFGQRHHTSQAAYRALLASMGIDCDDPEVLNQELARRRLGPWCALLGPVQAVFPFSGRVQVPVRPWAPSPELAGAYEARVELADDLGNRSAWETLLQAGPDARRRAVGEGWRLGLELTLPQGLEPGYYDLTLEVRRGNCHEGDRTRLIVAPEQAWTPDWLAAGRRIWGFNLPLYALRSKKNWGIGDFGDLAGVARWAGALGAGFVGVNPLHAPSGHDHPSPSPYSPTSRVFLSILYLDLEKVPELASCRAARELLASHEFHKRRKRLRRAPLLDYEEIYRLKRRVLGMLYDTFSELHGPPEVSRTPRGQEFARFLADRGEMLERFGQFCALADHLGESDWRRWPPAYHQPGAPAVADFSREHVRDLRLYQYGQWLAAGQLEDVCRQAAEHGLAFTLYADLALGATAGGFDTWAQRHLFAVEAAIGAPPDGFNPQGQNWGLPPLIPLRLRESGYQLFIDTLRANSPPGGMLRIDHVMSLFRLLWIPPGMAAADGAYVGYPARELLAILALESVKRRTLIVGEDLGTVPPFIRRDLAKNAVLSYKVFYFERGAEGRFLSPEDYPAPAVAAVTTHDLPTLAGFWEGRDLELRCKHKFYCKPEQAEADLAARGHDRRLLVEALQSRGLLSDEISLSPPGPCPPAVRLGVLEYLAQSPAALLEVRLEEVFGLTEQQNLPGTISEHPNWRVRLPLTLEEMAQSPEPARVAARLNQYRGR